MPTLNTNTTETFVNLTPHALWVKKEDDTVVIPPSGQVARVGVVTETLPSVGRFSISKQVFGEVEGLPEPTEGTYFIVSALVGGQVKGRCDVFGPDTGQSAIRNDKGHIIAVRGLVQFG